MIISFCKKLHASCRCKFLKSRQNFRCVYLELVQQDAGYTVRNPEISFILFYQLKHQPVGGKIALVRHFPANLRILGIVKIIAVRIKYSIVPQPVRLVDLEIKTY